MHHLVVDGPEAVEVEHRLVPGSDGLHLAIKLVTDTMVDVKQIGHGHKTVESLTLGVVVVAWQENTGVAFALDERVNSVTEGLDAGNDHGALACLVGEGDGLLNAGSASGNSLVVDACGVVNSEGNVFDTITVLGVVGRERFIVGVQG